MKNIIDFIRHEIVFCVAALCAAVSAFFVPPSRTYIDYIDWNTLFILFALMGVIGSLRGCGVFDSLARVLCARVHSCRGVCALLVLLCFFTSMFITNDVALLTFVPFSLLLLGKRAGGKTVLFVVVLETVAANMGSMLTPLGNPQNLFLFSKMNVGVLSFMGVILLYSAVSLALLLVSFFFIPLGRNFSPGCAIDEKTGSDKESAEKKSILLLRAKKLVFGALFVLCLLCVLRIVPKWISAFVVFAALIALDRKTLFSIDYMLLFTFAAFFVFTGNIASIGSIRSILQNAVAGHEFALSVLCSQVISNVPATLLLYPFAKDTGSLLVGVNVGGLGTLVASLASLISFKIYSGQREKLGLLSPARYLLVFTAVNVAFLCVLCLLRFVLG